MASPTPGRANEAPKWRGHVEVVASPATNRSSGGVELFLPLSQSQDSLVFVDARLSASSDSELFGNFGLALRRIIQSDYIIGASVFLDHTRSEQKRSYYGVTLGMEALTETLEARVNFHAPLTHEKLLAFRPAVAGGTLSLQNLRLVEQLGEAGFIRHEVPHYGVEGEVGVKLPIGLPDDGALRVFGGGYHYWASGMEDITGVSGRIEFETRNLFGASLPGARLTLAGLVRHDDVRDTEFGGEVRLRLPFGAAPPSAEVATRRELTPLERRMTNRIVRETEILTRTRTRVIGSGSGGTRLAINPETGEPYGRILFADGAGTAGAGTPEDPTTLDDAVDRAGVEGVVIAEGSAGPIGTGGIRLAEGMALLGGGTALPVVLAGGSITLFELGTTAATIQAIDAVNVIRLAEGTRVENITVTGGQTAIAGYGYGNVVLKDVAVSGTGGNAIAISNATGPLSFQNVSIAGSGGHGLVLNGAAGPVSIESLVVSGTAGHGISAVNNASLSIEGASVGGVGGDGVSIVNNTGASLLSANQVAVSSAAGAGFSVDGSAGGTTIVTSFANNVVQQAGAGGALFETVTFDTDPDATGSQPVPGGNLLIGNPAAPGNIGGDGLRLNDVVGAIAFDNLQIANDGGAGLFVRDSCGKVICPPAASFSFAAAGGAVDTGGGIAIDLDPVIVEIALSSVNASGGTHGILLDNVTGTFSVMGPVTIADVSVAGIAIRDSAGTFTFGDTSITDAGSGIEIQNVAGSVSFGATEIAVVADTAIALMSNPATVSFGDTTIADPGGHGIDIEGANGAVTFGATTITGLGAATGVDLTDGTARTRVELAFATLDISGTGAAGSKGIDYSGTTNPFDVVTLDSGTIQGVEIGVDLTDANATGFFQYGDGSNTDADGAASTIEAAMPLVVAGLNPANGLYNFLDVNLFGDTSNLSGADVFFVDVLGSGTGTADDPGSLADALASGADVIALVNTQARTADVIDAAAAAQGSPNTVSLAELQQLVSFAASDIVDVGLAGLPANLLLFGITPAQVVNPNPGFGAPVLTTSAAGSDTVTLGDGNILQGLAIANGAGANAVAGNGISGVTLFQSELTAGLSLANASGSANLNQSQLTTLAVDGGTINVNATGTSLANAAGGPIVSVSGGHGGEMNFDASSSIQAPGGGGLVFDNADGIYTFEAATLLTAVDIGIAILNGSAGMFAFGANTSIEGTNGTSFRVDSSAPDAIVYDGTINQSIAATAVLVSNMTGGTLIFGGAVTATTGAADAIVLTGNPGATIGFAGGLDISTDSGTGFTATGGGTVGVAATADGKRIVTTTGQAVNLDGVTVDAAGLAFDSIATGTVDGLPALAITNVDGGTFGGGTVAIGGTTAGTPGIAISDSTASFDFAATTISAAAGHAIALSGVTGPVSFGDTTIADPGGHGIDIEGANGAVTFGATTITGLGAATGVDLTDGTARTRVELTFATLDISGMGAAGSKGIDYSGTTNPFDVVTLDSGTIQGVEIGVDLSNASGTGFFQYGDGSNTDADGAASTIDAVVPLEIAGLNAANGIYNFLDVNLIGDTNNLTGVDVFFVDVQGAGTGTSTDPGSLANALASGAGVIALVNTDAGAADVIDAASAGQGAVDTVTLANHQQLVSFAAADTINVGAVGAPANLLLFGITPGEITNPNPGFGAPVLTTTAAGSDTVRLGDGNILQGLAIANGTGASAVAGVGISGVTLFQSELTAGLSLMDATGDANLNQSQLRTLTVDGGDININGNGVSLSDAGGGPILSFGGGHTGTLTFDAASTIGATGGGGLVFDNVAGSYTFNGTTRVEDAATAGIAISNSSGNVAFAGRTTILNVVGAGHGVDLGVGAGGANAGTYSFAGLDISVNGPGAFGFRAQDSGTVVITDPDNDNQITSNNGTAILINPALADIALTGVTSIDSDGDGINLSLLAGSTFTVTGATTVTNATDSAIAISGAGTIDFAGAGSSLTGSGGHTFNIAGGTASVTYSGDVDHASGAAAVSIVDHATGTVTFQNGTISATNGSGLQFSNADGVYDFAGTTTLAGGDARIQIVNGSDGTFSFGTDTSIVNPVNVAFFVSGGSADVTFDGDITANSGAAVTATGHNGSLIFRNGTIEATGAFGLTFSNADGIYDFLGTATLSSSSAIQITDGSDGTFNFGAGTSIVDPTSLTFLVDGGTADIVYSGDITQANNVALVSVTGGHSGSLTFDTGTISATNGGGLQFNNADGIYDFAGTTTVNGGTTGINIEGSSDGTFTFGTGTSIISPTGTAFRLDGGSADVTYSGDITKANAGRAVVVQNGHTGTLTFETGTILATAGDGIILRDAHGVYDFAGTTTLNGGNAAIDILNSGGTFSFGVDTSIANPTGIAFDVVGGSADVTYEGNITASNERAVRVQNHTGTVILRTGTIETTDGGGISFFNADGIYDFAGNTTLSGLRGITIAGGSDGTFSIADLTITNVTETGILIIDSAADVTFSGTTIVSGAGTEAVALTNTTGTIAFDVLSISNPGSAGIAISGTIGGPIDLGDVDIALETDGTTGLHLSGATVNDDIGASDFDLTSTTATGTVGVNLVGTTGTGTVTLGTAVAPFDTGPDSTITGVETGVLFSSATDLSFIFGDGEGVVDVGSTIDAVRPIDDDGTGLPAAGSYNFDDVAFVGDTSNISAVSLYFVDQTGAGNGSLANPGSIAGAELSTANVIVLIDTNLDGSSDAIDMTAAPHDSGNQALNLRDGQVVISFADGDQDIDVADLGIAGGGAPASFSFTTISSSTVVEAPDGIDNVRPTLTTDNATAAIFLPTVNVAGGPRITSGAERVLVSNTGNGDGFFVNADLASSFVLNRNDATAGGRAVAFEESNAAAAADTLLVRLSENVFQSTAGGPAVELTGQNVSATQSSLTVRGFADNFVIGNGAGGGVLFTDVGFDADGAGGQVAGGTLTIGQNAGGPAAAGDRVQGDGLAFINPTGDLAFTALDIANDGGTGLFVDTKGAGTTFNLATGGGDIDTTNGTAINLDPLTVGMTLSSVTASGGTNGILLDTVDGAFTVSGAVNINNTGGFGILLRDNTVAPLTATFSGAVSLDNATVPTTGGGLSLANSSQATVSFTGGLDIDTVAGTGIAVTGGGALTVSGLGNTIDTATGTGVLVDGSNGAIDINSAVTTAGAGRTAIIQNRTGGTATLSGNLISNSGTGFGVLVQNNSGGIVNFIGGTKTLNTGTTAAVSLLNNTGSTINFTGGGLDITTTSGTGFSATGGGTVTVEGTGNTITSNTGVAVNLNTIITGASGITFESVSKTSLGGASGIVLNNVTGAGSVNLGSGSILVGTFGALAFEVGSGAANSGGTAPIIYNGTITSVTNGRAVQIQNRAAGAGDITLSGNINHGAAQTGILVASNAGGTITFSGGTKSISSANANAVSLTNNAGATINFTNGGLAITTTTGIGFNATGVGPGATTGGTVTVQGLNNTISSTSTGAAALNVVNTTIGSQGLNFRSISKSGGANGIVLNNTGALGGLTVTGTGAAGSGGTIQATTSSGILLTNTRNVSLSNMNISGTGFHGIQGTSVTNLDLTNVAISNPGNAVNENGIHIDGLFGTPNNNTDSVFTNVTITGAADNGIEINNTTATNDSTAVGDQDTLTIRSSTISGSATSGILVTTAGSANFHLHVDGSAGGNTIADNPASGIRLNANGGTLRGTVNASTITGSNLVISGGATGSGQLLLDITGNTITQNGTGLGASGIAFAAFDSGRITGTISGNTIGTSQSTVGILGISLINEGSGQNTFNISGNTITLPDVGLDGGNSEGIFVTARGGSGRTDVTIANNTITNASTNVNATGINLAAGRDINDTSTLCVNFPLNMGNTVSLSGHPNRAGIGLSVSQNNNFILEGLGATTSDTNIVTAFVESRNPNAQGAAVDPNTGNTTFNDGTCFTP